MANSHETPLTVSAQKAAAQATLNESRLSLDDIAEQYPQLAEGVAELKAEAASKEKPKRARGGSILPMRSKPRRTIL